MRLQDYLLKKTMLHTEHLLLRTMDQNDIEDLKEWLSDLSLYEYWGKRPSKSELHPELLFQKQEKNTKSFHWGIVHKQEHKVIGEMWVYLIENHRMAKLAFFLLYKYRTEASMD